LQEKQKEKRKRHIWIPILNVIFVIIVVVAMLLMVVSELVLDKGLEIFGYSLETVAQQDVMIIKDGVEVVQIPYAAAIASYVNSVPGYVTVIFPPCVLLVILQVIASSLEKKQEAKEAEKKAEEEKTQPAQTNAQEHVYRPVINANASQTGAQPQEPEEVQVQELMQNIEQLKAALQQSQNQNEELRIRAVQAIKTAREQQSPPQGTIYQQPYVQMPPQMPQYPVYPVYPVYPPQQYYPQQGFYPPQMPPQGGFYPYPPQQGPMR